MKKTIFVLCSLLLAGYSFADGAFGTYKGMTKEELEKKGVKLELDWTGYSYASNDAPLKNKNLDKYAYLFDENGKLCQVTGLTFMHHQEASNDLAELLNNKIVFFTSLLSKKYGKPIIENNTLTQNNNAEWVDALSKNKANETPSYRVIWNYKLNTINNDIGYILLRPIVLAPYNNNYSGLVMVDYIYRDCKPAKQEKEQFLEDSKGL